MVHDTLEERVDRESLCKYPTRSVFHQNGKKVIDHKGATTTEV